MVLRCVPEVLTLSALARHWDALGQFLDAFGRSEMTEDINRHTDGCDYITSTTEAGGKHDDMMVCHSTSHMVW